MKNIAIFASGNGSNALEIIKYFEQQRTALVKFIVTNNPSAGVINRAKEMGISSFIFTNEELVNTKNLINFLNQNQIELIVLAGYLRMIPSDLIASFPNAILNIHPALLPDFGGKGMHGMHVHEAVLKNEKSESGITIHFVNEAYDEGKIIFQEKCAISKDETAESLAKKVLILEHKNYARVIEKVLLPN